MTNSFKHRNFEDRWEILRSYRQCQVFNNLINKVSQFTALPQAQIAGSSIIIGSLYTTVISNGRIPTIVYIGSVFFTVETVFYVFLLFDLASTGLIASKSFLRSLRKWPYSRNSLFRRYIKSLQPLRIYTGPFHVVDKGRAPALLRFCLQRTIFLVVKTRTGWFRKLIAFSFMKANISIQHN